MKAVILNLIFCASFCIAKQPIILWDLHGVLLHQQNPVTAAVQSKHFSPALTELSWPLIRDISTLFFSHYLRDVCVQEYLLAAQKHNAPIVKKLFLDVANAQTPNIPTIELLNELSALGYEQQVGSNIAQSSFKELSDPQLFPQFKSLFSPLNLRKSYLATIKNNVCIKKPNYRFFQNYLLQNNIDLSKQPVIFIDDRADNIAAAKALGFDAILFKNADQLRQQLINREIPISKPKQRYSNQNSIHRLYNPELFYR